MMKPTFSAAAGTEVQGTLAYVGADHAFRFDPASPADLAHLVGEMGLTSVTVGTLQIEVDVASRRALFVWGLHPRTRWFTSYLPEPAFRTGRVQVSDLPGLKRGVSIEAADSNAWSTVYDAETGWIRVGPTELSHDVELVLIATDTVLGLGTTGDLTSVWLHPNIDELNEIA